MPSPTKIIPNGNINARMTIHSSADLGIIVRERRKQLALTQADLAGVGGTGNRFIVDLENGKPTVQLQKTLDIMNLLGLEVIIRAKGAGSV
jgi:HTH-type transcriptional regulator/antitoxin HipB